MTTQPGASTSRRFGTAGGIALFALAVGQFLVGLDLSVMSVALPSIQREFDVGMAQLQWAVMAYMVAGAAFAVPFGALGDRVGRRRLYLVGTALFAGGSAISALAPNIEVLIAGRAVQGVGAGAMGTLALAMLTASVAHDAIPKLIGLWTAITAGASALGPLVGGAMVTAFGWRWVFGINVILIALMIPLVLKEVPRSAPDSAVARGIDWLGSGLLTIAMILIAGGLSLLEDDSITSPSVWGPVALGLIVVVLLGVQQRYSKEPLTDWATLRIPPIPAALFLLVLLSMVLAGAMLQQTMLVQNVLGFTPMVAGLVSFGASLMLVIFSPISPVVMKRIGLGPTTGLGLLLAAGGLFGMSTINASTSPFTVAIWLSILGAGLGFGMPAVSAGAMSAIPRASMGALSGFISVIGSISAILGIAVMGGLSAARTQGAWAVLSVQVSLPEDITGMVVSGAIPEIREQYGDPTAVLAGVAYTSGVTEALLIAGGALVVAAIFAVVSLGRRGKVARTTAPTAAPAAP